ncbi:MAG: hypothetical protein N2423_07390 [Novosphingobium sp.]|nr:hypothetical protein [Novosphingobium sp.]
MIGIAGPDLPHEVLLAAGRHAGPLAFDPQRDGHRAGRWLESKFAPWAGPLLEHWLDGDYNHLDAVLFSRADDTSQRLYYYICELRRLGEAKGPEPLIFDIARIPRAISRDRTVAEVRALASRLGVDDAALEAAIASTNARRTEVAAVPDGPRCLLVGSPPPDLRLHQVVEAAGFVPLGETLAQQWMALGEAVAQGTGDPAVAIGSALHARKGGPRSFADPAELLHERIAASGAAAVVLWRIEEDEAQCWHLPAERRVLEESGLPYLVMMRRDWLGRDGAAGEIAAFLQGLAR